jgi:hypothetical protein
MCQFIVFPYSFTSVNVFLRIVYLSGSTGTSVEKLILFTYLWAHVSDQEGAVLWMC